MNQPKINTEQIAEKYAMLCVLASCSESDRQPLIDTFWNSIKINKTVITDKNKNVRCVGCEED